MVTNNIPSVRPFEFESYGVHVQITGNDQQIVDAAVKVATRSLLNDVRPSKSKQFDDIFEFNIEDDGTIYMIQNGEAVGWEKVPEYLFKHFDSLIRATVAEDAVDRVFIHAGAVGWKGKAIVMPADSFQGKTTLVAELVRNGADYYSDDYAIFDLNGLMYPFPRTLTMRADDESHTGFEVTAEELGGEVGSAAIPVGTVLFTGYDPAATWQPKLLSAGTGVLEMIPYTFSFRERPDFSLPVLNNIASRAIILFSQRGSAEEFAKTFLNFVDKHVN